MASNPVVVYKACNEPMAHALASLLINEGIEAVVVNQGNAFLAGNMPVDWTAPRVIVPSEQETKALPIVAKFDAQLQEHPPSVTWADRLDENQTLDGHIWPTCPQCHARRPTECPYCQRNSDQFEAAYGTTAGERLTVVCPTCDEPFEPAFFRLCHKCDYDFGDGKQLPVKVPAGEPEMSIRAQIVLVIVLAVMGAIGAYLYFLTPPKARANSPFLPAEVTEMQSGPSCARLSSDAWLAIKSFHPPGA